MIQVRKSADRGHAEHGWLKSKHTFSFADYHDAKHMGFGPLRVINEDRIDGGAGFGTHTHRDMEIISYVIEGGLKHKDSMGNETVIQPGEVQRLTAGTGINHSEYNQLPDKTTHFLQIWIMPEKVGLKPGYGQKSFVADFSGGDLVLVASQTGRDGSVSLNQDADMYAVKSGRAGEKTLPVARARQVWVQVIGGTVTVDGTTLGTGDGAGIRQVESLRLAWTAGAEFIVFDLP